MLFVLLMEYTLVNVKEKIFWSALKNSTLGEEGRQETHFVENKIKQKKQKRLAVHNVALYQ